MLAVSIGALASYKMAPELLLRLPFCRGWSCLDISARQGSCFTALTAAQRNRAAVNQHSTAAATALTTDVEIPDTDGVAGLVFADDLVGALRAAVPSST